MIMAVRYPNLMINLGVYEGLGCEVSSIKFKMVKYYFAYEDCEHVSIHASGIFIDIKEHYC